MTASMIEHTNGFAQPPDPPGTPQEAPPLVVAVPPAAGPTPALRIPKREVWVDLPPEYPGFKMKVWVNAPKRIVEGLGMSEDSSRGMLSQCIVEHNRWCDYDGTEYPQPGETRVETYTETVEGAEGEAPNEVQRQRTVYLFWDAIPTELATVIIALYQEAVFALPNSLLSRKKR